MKKFIGYAVLMIIVVIIFPMLIVRGCDLSEETPVPEQSGDEVTDAPKIEDVMRDIYIKVYIKSEDKVKEMKMEEYIKGVVAAEMPAEFGMEALKAQAIAARTYAAKSISLQGELGNPYDVDTTVNTQVWISE